MLFIFLRAKHEAQRDKRLEDARIENEEKRKEMGLSIIRMYQKKQILKN